MNVFVAKQEILQSYGTVLLSNHGHVFDMCMAVLACSVYHQ